MALTCVLGEVVGAGEVVAASRRLVAAEGRLVAETDCATVAEMLRGYLGFLAPGSAMVSALPLGVSMVPDLNSAREGTSLDPSPVLADVLHSAKMADAVHLCYSAMQHMVAAVVHWCESAMMAAQLGVVLRPASLEVGVQVGMALQLDPLLAAAVAAAAGE